MVDIPATKGEQHHRPKIYGTAIIHPHGMTRSDHFFMVIKL